MADVPYLSEILFVVSVIIFLIAMYLVIPVIAYDYKKQSKGKRKL